MRATLQDKIKGIMVPHSMTKSEDQMKEDVFDHRKIINRESQIKDKRIIIERNKENIKRELAEFFRQAISGNGKNTINAIILNKIRTR